MRFESSDGDGGARGWIGQVLDLIRAKGQHARNLLSQLICRIIAIALFAIALPVFIGRQGAGAYGVLALLLSIYSVLILLDLGVSYSVGQRVGRSLARNDSRAPVIFARAIPLAIMLGAGVFLLLQMTARPFSSLLYGSAVYATPIRIFGATVGVYIISSTPAAVVQIHHRVDWFNYSKLIIDVAKSAALIVGALSRNAIDAAMWVLLSGAMLKCVVDFILAMRLLGSFSLTKGRMRWSDVRASLGMGLPMSVAGVASIVLTSGDRILVSRLYGPQALAHYSLAVDICSKAYFLVWAITGTVYPLVVRNAASRRDVSTYRRVGLVSVAVVGVLIYLPILLLARPAISWWLGPEMARGSSLVTSVWALTAVVFLMTSVLQYQLQAKGRPTLLLGVNVVGIALLLLGAWAVPRNYGIVGMAAVVGGVYLVQFCILWLIDNATARALGRRREPAGAGSVVRLEEFG